MTEASAAERADGLPAPRRYWAVLTLILAIGMAVIDGAIVNIALPTIARDLRIGPAASIWAVNAYQVAVTVALLPLASAGEIFGFRRVYRVGLAIFTVASLACALADSMTALIVARVAQGLGAAALMSVNTALIRFIYPRAQLGRGIAINALNVAVSSALGPTLAAGILSVASWHWLFAVNIPLGALALAAARALPPTPRAPHQFDWPSALLNAASFGALILGIDRFGHGAASTAAAGFLAVAILAGIALERRQRARPAPMLPVDLLRIPIFSLSLLTSVCSFAAQMQGLIAIPFYLQNVLGRSQVETGLLITPWPLAVAVAAPLAGRLADRYPAGLLGAIGMAMFAIGMASLALLPAQPEVADLVWRMTVCGLGFGLFQTPNNRTIIGSAPRERSGGASGMLGMARLFGQSIGAALVAILFGLFADDGPQLALAVGAGLAAVAAGVSSLRLAAWAGPGGARPKAMR